jgi:hypothetical protein
MGLLFEDFEVSGVHGILVGSMNGVLLLIDPISEFATVLFALRRTVSFKLVDRFFFHSG